MILKIRNADKTPSFPGLLHPSRDKGGNADQERRCLLQFNEKLDAKAKVFFLNEPLIEALLRELDGNISVRDNGYWWTLARINEMALLCAQNYANNCEFSLVGDLLINPRLVLVHGAGFKQPVAKKRHVPLSVQFQDVGSNLREIRTWLKTETLVEVRTEALLPDLFKKLGQSGLFDQRYLDAIEQRKRRIADLIGYLSSGGITDNASLASWLKAAAPADRKLIEASFCPLDFGWFSEMGRRVMEWGNSMGSV